MTEKHQLDLTQAAASLLGQLAATPGLATDPATLYRVGAYAEAHLLDLAPSPTQPGKDAAPAEWARWSADQRAWAKIPLQLPASDRQRDALRSLVKAAADKGALPASPQTATLLRALGLQPED